MSRASSDPRLAVKVAGVTFRNPFILASGPTTHSADQLARGCEMGWAGASIKLTFNPPPYINRVPRYGYFENYGQGFLVLHGREAAGLRAGVAVGARLASRG